MSQIPKSQNPILSKSNVKWKKIQKFKIQKSNVKTPMSSGKIQISSLITKYTTPMSNISTLIGSGTQKLTYLHLVLISGTIMIEGVHSQWHCELYILQK